MAGYRETADPRTGSRQSFFGLRTGALPSSGRWFKTKRSNQIQKVGIPCLATDLWSEAQTDIACSHRLMDSLRRWFDPTTRETTSRHSARKIAAWLTKRSGY